MSYKPYAGIGSRETPPEMLERMTLIAEKLDCLGFTLRSGGADGADKAFEAGAQKKEIFLPWRFFNNNLSLLFDQPKQAYEIAARFHPAWGNLKQGMRKLMARNVQQILGKELNSPSQFVICWTPDGVEHRQDRTAKTGGTGQAIAIASASNIPVFNLKNPDAIERLRDMLRDLSD